MEKKIFSINLKKNKKNVTLIKTAYNNVMGVHKPSKISAIHH
jgi:hypothetical protein